MRCIGILSDIHANLPALEAALRALEAAGVDTIVCCGDVIGIGPWPRECVERVRTSVDLCVRGNHEDAFLRGSSDPLLAGASCLLDEKHREYLASLPITAKAGHLSMVHGSFRAPMIEFLVDASIAASSFARFGQWIGLHGHTHIQSLFSSRDGVVEPVPIAADVLYPLDRAARYLVNPGSVGKPRDTGAGAAYALLYLEEAAVSFLRTPYDNTLLAKRQSEVDAVIAATPIPFHRETR